MARKFDPGRVAQHGFEYQKFAYYYLISLFKNDYDKYFYEGKEDVHFESSNRNEKLFVQVKTAMLNKVEKKKIVIKWLSIGEIADKYILMCEKDNTFDIKEITDDVITMIKNAKNSSTASNAKTAYDIYSANGTFDENKIQTDISLIKENMLDIIIKTSDKMFSELRTQMKEEAENASVIDSTLESRIYSILTKILIKIHNEYVEGMSNSIEILYNDFNNFYINARTEFPYDFFDSNYTMLKNSIDQSTLIDENMREVKQLRALNAVPNSYIVQQLINEIFYKEFRKFYCDINSEEEVKNIEEIAYQNSTMALVEARAKGEANPINVHFDTMKKPINHPFVTKMKGADFCTKGCYIYLTSDDIEENKQISWEIEE